MLIIGLMSGTSADGVDAALVEWPEGPGALPCQLRGFVEEPHPVDLQARIHRLADGRTQAESPLAELAQLDVLLGERFAGAAQSVAKQAGIELSEVRAIAWEAHIGGFLAGFILLPLFAGAARQFRRGPS